MFSYLCMFVLFATNFYINHKKGLSYPANYLMLYPFFFFVIKYFLYYFLDIEPLNQLGLSGLHLAGLYLLAFFATAFGSYYSLRSVNFPRVTTYVLTPRVSFSNVSYGLIVAILTLILVVNGADGLVKPYANRLLTDTQGMSYVFILFQLATLWYLLELVHNGRYRALVIFSVVYALTAFVTARAGLQLLYFVNLFLFHGIVYRKSIARYFIYIGLLGIPYVVLTGIQRVISFQSNHLTWEEVSSAIDSAFAQSVFSELLTGILHRVDQLESLSLLSNALSNGAIAYSYGEHMSEILFQWIPRAIWSNKPLNFTSAMTLQFRSDVFYSHAANNFTGVGEMLFNFGPAGVLLAGAGYGMLLAFCCAIWDKAKGSHSMAFILLGLIYPYMILSLLAGFINDFALPAFLISSVLLILMFKVRRIHDSVGGVGRGGPRTQQRLIS